MALNPDEVAALQAIAYPAPPAPAPNPMLSDPGLLATNEHTTSPSFQGVPFSAAGGAVSVPGIDASWLGGPSGVSVPGTEIHGGTVEADRAKKEAEFRAANPNAHTPTALIPGQNVLPTGKGVVAPPLPLPVSQGGASAPVTVGKPFWQAHDRKVEEGLRISDDTNAAIDTSRMADKDLRDITVYQEGLVANAALRKADVMAKQAELDRMAADAKRNKDEAQLASMRMDIDSAVRSVALEPPPDGRRWWSNANTAQKAGAMVSILIGGFLQGYRGLDKNPGLEAINRLEEQDYLAQKEKHKQLQGNVDNAKTMYDLASKMFSDSERRDIAMRIMGKESLIAKLDAEAADYTIDADKAKFAAQVRAKWAQDVADQRLKLEQLTRDKIVRGDVYRVPTVGGTGATKLDDSRAVRLADGRVIYAPDDVSARQLRSQSAAFSTLRDKVAEVKKLANDPSAYLDGRLSAAQGAMVATAKEAAGPGMNSDKDMEMLKSMVGVGDGNVGYGAKQILGLNRGVDEASKLAELHYNNTIKSVGTAPVVQTGFAKDPKTGAAIQTGRLTGATADSPTQTAGKPVVAPHTPPSFKKAGQ